MSGSWSWSRLPGRVAVGLRTARHLRPRQLLGQLTHRARGPARNPKTAMGDGCTGLAIPTDFSGPSPEGRLDDDGAVRLLGQPGHDPLRLGWAQVDDPLWSYTLHYHGWLGGSQCDPARGTQTILDWIDQHKHGVGWEPYPVSMRVFSWLGWLARNRGRLSGAEFDRILSSLSGQLDHLADNIEIHLDGNHLWTNLAALVAAGLALRGPQPRRLLERFAPRLSEVIRSQLGADGVHRERTPTYHCLLAEQLAMVRELARDHEAVWQSADTGLQAMLGALPAFTHPDGDVALWGDSQRGAAACPKTVAARGRFEIGSGSADAPQAGFARRAWGPWTVLYNVGYIGLGHQCGHIHADALSVELSLGDERVVVDAGTGTYTPGPDRDYARSTRAHNTVTVGVADPDQHEMWKSHRIGTRAEPVAVEQGRDRLVGQIRGHRSPATHHREVRWDGEAVEIVDRIDDDEVPATARLFLPADVRVAVESSGVRATTANGTRFDIEVDGAPVTVSSAPGWTAMGVPSSRTCVAAVVGRGGVKARFRRID